MAKKRVLIFNCTSGRSGGSFLGSMIKNATERLELHKSEETSDTFFDTVIFCTNVTYADGHFKGGASFLPHLPRPMSPDRTSWGRSRLAFDRDGGHEPGQSPKRTRGRLVIPDTQIPHDQCPRLAFDRTCDPSGEGGRVGGGRGS